MVTPEAWHQNKHDGDYEDCRRCAKRRADCERKIRFSSREECNEWVDDLNASRNYQRPVVTYRCMYCSLFHMTTATKASQRKRAEQARRRWLIQQRRTQ